jgi:hypothetical protein
VYAVIAVMISGWTITAFLWKLSVWLQFLSLGEIFTIFSYAMTANLIESLIVLALLLMAGAFLPPAVLRADFAVRGTILSLGIVGSLMAYLGLYMLFGYKDASRLLWGPLAVVLLTALLLLSASKFRFAHYVRSAILWLSDRMTVFLFILVPLFATLAIYVIFRNIIGVLL